MIGEALFLYTYLINNFNGFMKTFLVCEEVKGLINWFYSPVNTKKQFEFC